MKKMSNDEERFNLLKAQFGSDDEADKLTLEEFAALSDKRAETLVDRSPNAKIAGEISAIRKRAIQTAQASQPSGKDRFPMILFATTNSLSLSLSLF